MLIVELVVLVGEYFMYSKFIAYHIIKLDPNFNTPSHELKDEIGYVSTNKYIFC